MVTNSFASSPVLPLLTTTLPSVVTPLPDTMVFVPSVSSIVVTDVRSCNSLANLTVNVSEPLDTTPMLLSVNFVTSFWPPRIFAFSLNLRPNALFVVSSFAVSPSKNSGVNATFCKSLTVDTELSLFASVVGSSPVKSLMNWLEPSRTLFTLSTIVGPVPFGLVTLVFNSF